MKKIFIFISICVTLLYPTVLAYEYENPDNESRVLSDIDEIYSLKAMYDEFAGDIGDEDEVDYQVANNSQYWWPIGSIDTTTSGGVTFASGDPEDTTITSYFGYRDAINSGGVHTEAGGHGALDIANYTGVGKTNIIAAKDGVVVYPSSKQKIDCVKSDPACNGYGNYVIIQHSDGNYTLYAHLDANSINVFEGDTVSQGQVIAKMGTSGNSTGPHLHFEIRLGENTSAARVDPLNYVSMEEPRPSSSESTSGDTSLEALLDYINIFEGVGCWNQLSEEGDNYVACIGNDNVITVGHGVVWESNKDRFISHGITNVSAGSRVPKSVVDDIQLEILNELHESIIRDLADAGIDNLKDYQINALTSQAYNGGYTVIKNNKYGYDFISNWKKYNGQYSFDDIYKNQGNLWYDSLCRPYGPGTANEVGLQRRRVSEWMMFNTGEMDHLEQGFDPSKYAWPE